MPSRPLLCVDDESSNLATLRQLLRDDFALVFAKSGGEALDAVSRHAPKLILLDVELPDMDGYAVARALKQQPSSNAIPILFVTSRNSEHDERLGWKRARPITSASPTRRRCSRHASVPS